MASEGGLVVALDTDLTPELEKEGLAREIVRHIQDLRKQADYNLTDRVLVQFNTSGKVAEAIAAHQEAIASEVLAEALEPVEEPAGDVIETTDIDDVALTLAVRRATA